jgi:pyruvate,water dikinase
MSLVIALQDIRDEHRTRVGGKAFRLAAMHRGGMTVPRALCICADAYREFLQATRLGERIHFELNRKAFEQMRWEEIWDAALRIRNLFINTPMPDSLWSRLACPIDQAFRDRAVAVRSSGEGEDATDRSFAGLHESFLNVRGTRAILDHVKLVWASLWSDRALLYRRELGLDIGRSTMSVLVQECCVGDVSGVAFSRGPAGEDHAVVEAVYGLNQGLVDGTVEPDRWIVDRGSGRCLDHHAPEERKCLVPAPDGVMLTRLPSSKARHAPLDPDGVVRVNTLALKAEALFGSPQDTEWTLKGDALSALQSRPITTLSREDDDDQRPWYLSLRRSFENLKALRRRIEEEILPSMDAGAKALSRLTLEGLSNQDLASEIEDRHRIYQKWQEVYWADCIPLAHGMRLFAEVYNNKVRPTDPYEFMDLLGTSKLAGLERNRRLEEMATLVRDDPDLASLLRQEGAAQVGPELSRQMDTFIAEFGCFSRPDAGGFQGKLDRDGLAALLLELAGKSPSMSPRKETRVSALKDTFFAAFEEEEREYAAGLLDLGRASYRLRDDDNIYLGRIEWQLHRALEEGRGRLRVRGHGSAQGLEMEEVLRGLRDPSYVPREQTGKAPKRAPADLMLKARQLVGQPAGPGVARGRARVINEPGTSLQFKSGEVLVCDAVDPGMTFVVPLAAGIVERRGGMLIHGAIIAREYGLPCVTGVPDATSLIKTGDQVTVDGYLGIVIVG